MWILLIEDDIRIADMLKRGLEEEGHAVDLAADGETGQDLAMVNAYDALIVDWRLPNQDGKTMVKNVRDAGNTVPIIMLTALADVGHRVEGLDAGADDYLAKPFAFDELLARLRALMRRPPLAMQDHLVTIGPLELDTERRQARVKGVLLNLRPKEYALLEVFMRHPKSVFSRTALAERIWGSAYYVSNNVIDVTVSGLRQKLALLEIGTRTAEGKVVGPVIETVRGVGYRFSIDGYS